MSPSPIFASPQCSGGYSAGRPKARDGEVDEIFSVPLSFLLAVENYQICKQRYLGVDRFYYTIPYGPYYIWGATARMLRGFAERMAQCN